MVPKSKKFKNWETNEVKIKRRVRQAYILSPLLFNLYNEAVYEAIVPKEAEITISSRVLISLRSADDTAVLANNIEDLQLFNKRT